MITTASLETARIEALLAALDPEPSGVCDVAGCVHLHGVLSAGAPDLTALAA